MELSDLTGNLSQLNDLIEAVVSIPDETLNEQYIESLIGAVNGAITPSIRTESVFELINNFTDQGYSKRDAENEIQKLKDDLQSLIKSLDVSEKKEQILNKIFENFYGIFDDALENYKRITVIMPISLDEGATAPAYAHDTDAGADLAASETITIPAHSTSTMVKTGVHIALPEGWVGYIVPRSSIGYKTPLRLSNSVGVIDESYRGQLGVLYDNISDSDYTINAGDRIAQLIVMPCYRFKPHIIERLPETERGAGGFGSSGK